MSGAYSPTRLRVGTTLGLALALLTGCAPAPNETALVGCLQLDVGPWIPPLADAKHGVYALPRVVRLDSAPTNDGGGRRLSPRVDWRDDPRMAEAHIARWQLVRPDSLELLWHSGFVAFEAALEPGWVGLRRGWRGEIRFLTDVRPSPVPTAALRARPIPCPDALAGRATADPPAG